MDYLKIWLTFEENLAPLSDEETGRLLRMMLHYVETGEVPTSFKGNELFVWAAARQMIDAAEAKVEKLRNNGSKGGRPGQQGEATESNRKQTKANESNGKQAKADESLNVKDKDKDNVKVKEKEQKERFVRFWAAYPRKTAKETALRAFLKIAPDESLLQQMLSAIEKQKETAQWQEDGGRYIPHPATWLNQKRWQDEVTVAKKRNESAAGNFEQRDYSGVQQQLRDDMTKEMDAFFAGGEAG